MFWNVDPQPTKVTSAVFGPVTIEHLEVGARGHALQELHKANTLNKWDEETAFLLGKLYVEEGVYPRARKYFDLPGLKNTERSNKLIEHMAAETKRQQRQPWILGGASTGMLLAPLPVLAFLRRRKRQKSKIITAENFIQEFDYLQAHQLPQDAVPEETAASAVTEVVAPVASPPEETRPTLKPVIPQILKPDVEIEPVTPTAEIIPFPVFKNPMPVQQEPPQKVAPAPAPAPIEPPAFEHPVMEPVMSLPTIEAPRPPAPTERPAPPPPLIFTNQPGPADDREVILKMGKAVDESLVRGNDYAAKEEWPKALKEYHTALALEPYRIEALLGVAYVNFAQGDWERALHCYVKALEINPQSAEAYYGIGRVCFETNQIEEAAQAFRYTLTLDPAFDDARTALTLMERAA